MKSFNTFSILLVAVMITGVSIGRAQSRLDEQQDLKIVAEGNNRFALDLYARLRQAEGNLFLSPYSISTALAMTYAGARGDTERQMAAVLRLPTRPTPLSPDRQGPARGPWEQARLHRRFGEIIRALNAGGKKGAYELHVANALWPQEGFEFLREFLQTVESEYYGRLTELDFVGATEKARVTINRWVEKKTNGNIKDLIGRGVLDRMTRLVLTNAIYFKGDWARQFEKGRTLDAPFTLPSGEKIDIPMMNQTARFKYAETEDLQLLELPYAGDDLSMVVLLPKRTDGLADIEKKLTAESLSAWLAPLRGSEVVVSVPRFKMTRQFSLASVLKSMGMTDAFSGRADFSGMNGRRNLFISAVIHKAYVDVTEEGTEAAAATAVGVKLTAVVPAPKPVFRADHPFLFLIRHNQTGSILFLGRLVNPED